MIRNKNARRRMRENRKEISAWMEEFGATQRDAALNGPVKIDTHVIVARSGTGSLPFRRGWKAMRAMKARS